MRKSVKSALILFVSFLLFALLQGCRQSTDLSSANLPAGAAGLSALHPDTFIEVDCLLPGQVRKLGTMVYASPRRPIKTTAGDCEIRGGEYVVFDRANYKDALAVWMVEAEGGDPVAMTYVGEIYMKSPPESPRYDLAFKWFEGAARKGHKRAQVNLGYLYENGLGVAADADQAVAWYGKASGTDLKEIVQQQQLSAAERAELAELKAKNAAQIGELQRLKEEITTAQATLGTVRKELDQRNRAIEVQQREIAGKQKEMKRIEQQLAIQKAAPADDLKAELATLQSGLQEKERELAKQKRLADELAGQVKRHQRDEQKYQETLTVFNTKLANLPGPKIEVLEPQLLRTRGIVVAPVDKGKAQRTITGKVWSPAGLQYLRVNGRETEFKTDGNFMAVLPMETEKVEVKIVAADTNGKTDEMQFTLQQHEVREGSAGAAAGGTTAREGVEIEFGRYYALVIGNNEYQQLPKLQTAVADAREVGALLEQRYGFQVTVLLNADRKTILSTLNDFRKKLTEKDNLLIYYAGHGTLEEKNAEGFWLPVDSSPDDDVNWLPTERITGIMNLMSAKQIMVIADACYSGFMTRAALTRLEGGQSEESYNKWLKKMVTYKSRVVISSGENKPVLDGGGGSHSVFARALLDALRNNSKILLGIDLHRAIAERVVDASGRIGHDQVPQYAGLNRAGHELGDFLFVPTQHGG